MSKSKRRTLGFDCLEGKVLLSRGMADPAAMVHRARAAHLLLNGTLYGLPFGTVQHNGVQVSSFSVVGKVKSMGRVTGSFNLADPFIPQGKLPDLGGATLTLSNSQGSVQLIMASSPSNRYIFVVTAGTGGYASQFGSGTAVISYSRKMIDFAVKLRSSNH